MDAILVGAGLAVFGVLFVAGCIGLGLCLRAFAHAIADLHRARSHGYAADAERYTVAQATEALDDVRRRRQAPDEPPTPDEILEFMRDNPDRNAREYTTDGNAGIREPENDGLAGVYKEAANL